MSINVPLALPKTNEGILLPSVDSSVVGVDHGVIRIKVANYRISMRNNVEITTGDRNPAATVDVNQLPVTVIQLSGFILANDDEGSNDNNIAVALAGKHPLVGDALNNGTWVLRLNLADSIHLNGYVVVADAVIEGSQDGATIRVAITLYMTDTLEEEIFATLGDPAEPSA